MIKELSYTVTKNYLKNVPTDLLNVKIYKKTRIKYAVAFAILFSFLYLFVLLYSNAANINFHSIYFKFMVLFLLGVFTGIMSYFYYPKILATSFEKLNSGNELNVFIKINSDEDFLIVRDNVSELKYTWNGIKEIYNEHYTILLFVTDYKFITIPKDIFNNTDEINELWNIIQECFNRAHSKIEK